MRAAGLGEVVLAPLPEARRPRAVQAVAAVEHGKSSFFAVSPSLLSF